MNFRHSFVAWSYVLSNQNQRQNEQFMGVLHGSLFNSSFLHNIWNVQSQPQRSGLYEITRLWEGVEWTRKFEITVTFSPCLRYVNVSRFSVSVKTLLYTLRTYIHEIAGYTLIECLVLVFIREFPSQACVVVRKSETSGKPQYMQPSQKCQVNSPRKERFTRDSARTSLFTWLPR